MKDSAHIFYTKTAPVNLNLLNLGKVAGQIPRQSLQIDTGKLSKSHPISTYLWVEQEIFVFNIISS